MFVLNRECNTNQKITIDLSMDNKWLVSGGSDGKVQVWNVSEQHYPSVHMQVSENSLKFTDFTIFRSKRKSNSCGLYSAEQNWRCLF